MAARVAVSLLCLLGTVSAQGYNTTSSTGATATTYSDGAEPTIAGVTYLIQTDTNYNGVTINLARKSKRASDPGLSSCLSTCSSNVACVGTAYDSSTSSCTFYSAIDQGTEYDAPGVDFATVESRVSGGTTSRLNGTTATGSVASTRTGSVSTTGYNNATTPIGGSKTPSATGSGTKTSSTKPTGSSTSSTGAAVSTPTSIITIDGVEFLIEIDITYAGIFIDIDIIFAKRATYTLEDCLTTCANETSCAGTAFDSDSGSCTFYSSITSGSRTVANGTTFGTVIYRAGDSTDGENSAESLICPSYNGHVITSEQGDAFSVGCSEIIVGTTFDINANTKRQADTGLPQTLSNCVDICATSDACLGTSFEIATETCTFYSAVRYTVAVDGVDSASRISTGVATTSVVTSYVPTTVPVTTTVVVGGVTTVTAGVVTSTVTALYTGSSTIPGSAAGTGASYTTVTATVFTTTVTAAFPDGSGVATSVVPVGTTTYVGAVPSSVAAYGGSGATTTVTVTVGGSDSGSGSGSGAGGSGSSPSTVTVYTCPTANSFTTVYV